MLMDDFMLVPIFIALGVFLITHHWIISQYPRYRIKQIADHRWLVERFYGPHSSTFVAKTHTREEALREIEEDKARRRKNAELEKTIEWIP